jgi:hypothetical protein
LSTWGAKSGDLTDLKRLADALEPFDYLSVQAFCNQLGQLSSERAPASRLRTPSKSKCDEQLAARYVALFSAEELDHAGLKSALAELGADKKVKVPELTAIASQLSGVESKYNKKTALEKIEAVVRRRLDTRRRLDGTSGIF